MVLKEIIFNSFFGQFVLFNILGGCGGLERTDFLQFVLLEGVVVLKEWIF